MIDSATVAAIVTPLAFVVGAVFSTLTIRQWQRTRHLAAAGELVHTMQTAEFTSEGKAEGAFIALKNWRP